MIDAEPDAETRITRVMLAVLAVTTVAFAVLNARRIAVEADYMNPIWYGVGLVIVFGIPLFISGAALVLPLRVIRITLRIYCVLYLIVGATWLTAMNGEPIPILVSPWPVTAVGLATTAAAIAWEAVTAWVYFFVVTLAIVPLRYYAAGQVEITLPLQDSLFWITAGAIFTALVLVTRGNARALDQAVATARATTASAAAVLAREREQARLDALVHDEVISTLHYASLGRPELAASVQRQAIRAVAELARLRTPVEDSPPPVDVTEFVGRIRSIVFGVARDLEFSVAGTRTEPLPADVAAAFGEAAAEAVRNSIAHANVPGRATARSARLVLGPGGMALQIDDDGAGFEKRDVSSLRLGIDVSIRGRFATLTGGSATVRSQRGRGTTVSLEWVQP